MSADLQESLQPGQSSQTLIEQKVLGSRKTSNYIVGLVVSLGGIGFILASFSSFRGQDFLPIGHPSSMIFVPQGLIMGLYGIAAFLIAIYLWSLIARDFGAGTNRFDKQSGNVSISRKGFLKEIKLEVPLKDVKAVKLEIREGLNPRRRIALRVQGRKDIPLGGVGQPRPLLEVEQEGAELARFLGVNLEGL